MEWDKMEVKIGDEQDEQDEQVISTHFARV
jgi:hypothetical protein